ncbi:tryptophan synthase subunit alpha [Desulfosporosinus nitroreducens]|uniref:Tryptophan synthase alpha chain n=1 Tax=Desulfosporosinus nitroreducens TaxID=2018668 RepID=A0ABT8QSG3_9FIRM|nr:tryptophan synthase subunit alpha [Desulfosporosinus nitroreducens]MCO1603725.1 tryptophan synthase subunit alpha [Desulfosporosinus nitroreducens]MDO0824257.1 tryptophan synthase subunit alpha [Desulfosporosinus nitroreducens]
MSERLKAVFKSEPTGVTRLVSYIMAGDPSVEASLRRLKGLADHGVDVLELGVPFSDPMADGVVIQAAAERALNAQMTVKKTLELVREFRRTHDTPLLLMSYLNPLLRYGWDQLAEDAADAGVDGFILPDLPWREGQGLRMRTKKRVGNKLDFIPMIAQTSREQDIQAVSQVTEGFAYVISRNGITGGEVELPASVNKFIESLGNSLQIPRCVGFGIQKPEQVRALAKVCDGVVVGSALVKAFAKLDQKGLEGQDLIEQEKEVFSWLASLKN